MSGWECRARVLAFSPADGALALGCVDGVVRFREPGKWTQIRAWPGHVHGITSMSFRPVRRAACHGRPGRDRARLGRGHRHGGTGLLPQRDRWAAAADGAVREHGDAAGLVWFAAGLSREAAASLTVTRDR